MTETAARKPSFAEALGVVVLAGAIISFGILKLGVDAHIPIIFSAIICSAS